jgi:hypothetical protein
VYLLRQVKSPSIKPWLAGRQPSDRGGVPQVRTWLLPPPGGTQQARVLPPSKAPDPDAGLGLGSSDSQTNVTPATALRGHYEETSR